MPRISVEAQRREQILDAAIAVVARKGYEATTVRDVAGARRGLDRHGQLLLRQQGRRAGLGAGRGRASASGRRLDEALAGVDDPHERLERMAGASDARPGRGVANQVVWTEFWLRATRTEQLRDAARAAVRRLARRASPRSCATASARGAFRDVDADEWATAVRGPDRRPGAARAAAPAVAVARRRWRRAAAASSRRR